MLKINKIITALGNQKINKELKNNYNVPCNDIFYKEGVLEYLEKNNQVDYIILEENLPGEISINELIEKIKEKNKNIKIVLISKNNEKNEKIYKKIQKLDINLIKNAIFNKNSYFNMRTIPINNFSYEEKKKGKIITILGSNGIGKSIFSLIFSKNMEKNKILILDFDIFNNSIINLLGVKRKTEKIKQKINKNNLYQNNFYIEDFIINAENNIDIISGVNLIFNSELQLSSKRIRNIINNLKEKYDYILVDTSAEGLLEYTKETCKISDKLIFISGANLLEIKKSQKLLDIYTNEWEIPKFKIKIIINKYTKQSIDDEILRNIFKKFEILGKIKLSDYYDLAINKNDINKKEIKKDIEKIERKIAKVKIIRKK